MIDSTKKKWGRIVSKRRNLFQNVLSIRVVGQTVSWYELTLGNKEVRNTETVHYNGVVREPHRLCIKQVGLRPLDHLTC